MNGYDLNKKTAANKRACYTIKKRQILVVQHAHLLFARVVIGFSLCFGVVFIDLL